ncbi:hypothetical protein NP493_8g06018 [Ridgeia piscesae]|uniref:Uncharacterized protein n=1 Tax=Ridgeia piscesae TaxID=27915 RepID=A0AAD9PFQ6_RIDPI|nr:hypothetical protein NP493_8g06018 [Ridgeia piscesae]
MGRRHRGARVYSIGEGVGWGYGSVLIWAARRRVAHACDRHHACTFTACVQRHRLTFSLLSTTGFGGIFLVEMEKYLLKWKFMIIFLTVKIPKLCKIIFIKR